MHIKGFIWACLLFATMANASADDADENSVNFCRKVVESFSDRWIAAYGGNELIQRISAEHVELKNWSEIKKKEWTQYSESVTGDSREANVRMCIDFRQFYEATTSCQNLLKSKGRDLKMISGEFTVKSFFVCASMDFDEGQNLVPARKNLALDPCKKTVEIFRNEWQNLYGNNEVIKKITDDYLQYSEEKWTDYRAKFLRNESGKRMCIDFKRMMRASKRCIDLVNFSEDDLSKTEDPMGLIGELGKKTEVVCKTIFYNIMYNPKIQ